jgi:hypothetical protein
VSILRSLGYPNRVVALLTPVLTPLAGWFASFIADRVPGIPKDALNEIFIAGSLVALAPALQFLHGRLKWDLQQDEKETLALAAAGTSPSTDEFAALGITAPAAAPVAAEDAGDDFSFDDEEDASTDILDEVGGLLDDEEELDGFPDPLQTTAAGS